MQRAWVATYDCVGVRGVCPHRGHANLGGLCCHLSPWGHAELGCLHCPPGNMVMFGPELLLRDMSVTMALLWLHSLLTSMAPVTTEGHVKVHSLGQHLKPYWSLRVSLPPGPYKSEWPSSLCLYPGPETWLRAISGSIVLPHPGSVLMCMTPLTIVGQAYANGLGCHLETC